MTDEEMFEWLEELEPSCPWPMDVTGPTASALLGDPASPWPRVADNHWVAEQRR